MRVPFLVPFLAMTVAGCATPPRAPSPGPELPPKIVLAKDPTTTRQGTLTPRAAEAKRLFDAGSWFEAAVLLHDVSRGETGDDEHNRQLAQYHLAIALYHLGFVQGAYAIFSQIADTTKHPKHGETLLWFAKLATELPDGADVVERIGKYGEADFRPYDTPDQRPVYWELNYLLGRHRFRNRRYEDAIRLFANVAPESRDYYVKAQFLSGMSSVQLRRSVPAVEAFHKMADAADGRTEEGARMLNVAFSSLARTYYSAAIRLDEHGKRVVDRGKLAGAVAYWARVGGDARRMALFEQSWAYFMASDFSHASENLRAAADGPLGMYAPEAGILQAILAFTNRRYAEARSTARRVVDQYRPAERTLRRDFEQLSSNGGTSFLLLAQKLRRKEAGLPGLLGDAMSDRQLGGQLAEVDRIRDEADRLEAAPPAFRASPLGRLLADEEALARDAAERNANELAKSRYARMLAELDVHLRDADDLLVDVAAAEGTH